MAKGYWVAHVDVHDPELYAQYRAANAAAFAQFGARFLVRGGERQLREGEARSRTVVIEFPSYADAIACYESDAYKAALAIREKVSQSDLVIIEGYDG